MIATPPPFRSTRILLVFALAHAGGVIGYLPLLTLLLPMKIEAVSGEARLGLLTVAALAGALAASLSNILFGWWSDRSVARGGGRRRFVAAGLAAAALGFAAIAAARTPTAIVLAVTGFQIALNAMLGPLFAAIADEVPDDRKGMAGGLLALANPMAAGASALVVDAALPGEGARYAVLAAAMAACTLPLLLTRAVPASPQAAPPPADRRMARRDLAVAWTARLLIQLAGGVLFHYLLYYFESVERGWPPQVLATSLGRLMTLAYLLPLPVAVVLGRWSDRRRATKPVLLGAAMVAAAGLAAMAAAVSWTAAAAAFAVYVTGSSTFLALHATFAMRLLPSVARRGRDLGWLNLTNTLPSILGPILAWCLADPGDFDALMLVLAVLTAIGGGTMLAVRGGR